MPGSRPAATVEPTEARVHHVAFDITDSAAVAAGVAAVQAEFGPLDILVNNAGMQHRAPLLDFPDDAWHRVLDSPQSAHMSLVSILRPPLLAA